MDREVILYTNGEEIEIGFVSEFLRDDAVLPAAFERIREAIAALDLSGFDTQPIFIDIF